MRNLKKILALVLALVMSLSLMSVAGATEFPDSDQISETYAESVDVLTGLKVFQGNKGEFKPKDNITRAEVANIIYRIVTGDVDGTSVGIYADYNKFTDVPNTAWFAGCVNYCANAEYIKGRGNGKFDPYGNVTGYEALAMILRAIGYDKNGEFTGANWQVQTAATARNRGITKNIVEGTLGVAASREMVAEILCQTILVPVADYSLAFGYRTTDAVTGKENETLAKKTFKMEKLEGVVTANEYASLTATSPLAAGQTTIGDKTLNVTSTLDDLGESRYVYVIPQTGTTRYDLVSSKVYDTGDNNVYDSGDAVKTVDKDTGKDNGITSITGAQHFINYDEITEYTTNMRLSYVIFTRLSQYDAYTMLVRNGGHLYNSDAAGTKGTEVTGITAAGQPSWSTVIPSDGGYWIYEKDINAFTKLEVNGYDYNNIRDIFIRADLSGVDITRPDRGEVYEGTTSVGANGTGRPADLSDSINWDTFVAKYLVGDNNKKQITSNGLGDRLKIVDNNNDGVAEYVLQTIYTLALVSNVASDGKITLDITNADFDRDVDNGVTCHTTAGTHWVAPNDHRVDTVNHVTTQKVINDGEAELATGNAVIYAVIDGNVRVQLAETVAATVNTVNRATRVATTSDGDELNESAVHEHSTALTHGVSNLVGGTTYTLYKDLYGNLAAFTEGANGEFVLITDGWYDNRKAGAEYAVRAFIDGSIQTVDITSGGSLFIGSGTAQNNAWGQLREIAPMNNDGHDVTTMVANLQNGVLTPVDKMYLYSRSVRMLAMNDNVIPRRDNQADSKGVAYETVYRSANPVAYNTASTVGPNADGSYDVRALSTTTYYYVYNYLSTIAGTNNVINTVVRSYTGYANAPAVDKKDVEDVYVVGTRATNANGNAYYTADVVVVELNNTYRKSDSEQVFIPAFTVANNNLHYEDVELIRGNGAKETVTIDLWKSTIRSYDPVRGIGAGGLYYMDESDTEKGVYIVLPMSNEDISYGRYAVGYIDKDYATSNDDWDSIELYTFDTNNLARAAEDPVKDTDVVETAKRNVEGSKYYTLGYNSDRSPILNESVRQTVMNQSPDGSHVNDTTAGWINETQTAPFVQKNEVLVAYNGSNQIVYAISFRDYISNSSNDHDVQAQQMWRNNMPSTYKHETPVEATTMDFFGIKGITPDANNKFTAEVSWSAATPDGNNIVVNNGTIVTASSATTADKKSAATVRTTGEKVYTGVIVDAKGNGYTYELTQKAQHTLHTLRSKSNTIATIAGNVITTAAGGQSMAISQFQANFVAGGTGDNGCGTCEVRNWKFYNASGILLDTATNTMKDVDAYTVEVYNPETGETQTYYHNGTYTPVTTRTVTAQWDNNNSPVIMLYRDSALTTPINPDYSRSISATPAGDNWEAQWTVPDGTTVYAVTVRAYAGDFYNGTAKLETTQSNEADLAGQKIYTNSAAITVNGANISPIRFQMRPLPQTAVNVGLVNADTTNITNVAMPTGYTNASSGTWYVAPAVPVGEDGSESVTFVLTLQAGYMPTFTGGTGADYGTITKGSAANTWNVTLAGADQNAMATVDTITIGSLLMVYGTPVDDSTPATLTATVVNSKEVLDGANDVTGVTGVTINGWAATAAQAEAGTKSAQLPNVDSSGDTNDLYVNFTYNANHTNYTGTVKIDVTRAD